MSKHGCPTIKNDELFDGLFFVVSDILNVFGGKKRERAREGKEHWYMDNKVL